MTVSALRTLVIGSPSSIYGVCPVQPVPRWPIAEPDDNLDYSLDLEALLSDVTDTIAAASWAIAPSGSGEQTLTALDVVGSVITAQVVGGVSGRTYQHRVQASGTSGRVWVWFPALAVDPTLATWPLPPPPSLGFGTALTWGSGSPILPVVTSGLVVATELAATGTNQATALPLPAQTCVFTSVPAGAGAMLNAVLGTGVYRVINASGTDLLIYPPGTAQINAYGAGVPIAMSDNQTVDFVTESPTTQWYAT